VVNFDLYSSFQDIYFLLVTKNFYKIMDIDGNKKAPRNKKSRLTGDVFLVARIAKLYVGVSLVVKWAYVDNLLK